MRTLFSLLSSSFLVVSPLGCNDGGTLAAGTPRVGGRLTEPCKLDPSLPYVDCWPSIGAPPAQKTLHTQQLPFPQSCAAWPGGAPNDVPGFVCANGFFQGGAKVYQPQTGELRYRETVLPSNVRYAALAALDLDNDGCSDLLAIPVPAWMTDTFNAVESNRQPAVAYNDTWQFQIDVWRGNCAWGLDRALSTRGLELTLPNGSVAFGIAVLDINNDGILDVLVYYDSPIIQRDDNKVAVFLSQGRDRWVSQPQTVFAGNVAASPSFTVNVDYVDDDARPDLLYLSSCSPGQSAAQGTCNLLLGTGGATPSFVDDRVQGSFDPMHTWSPMGSTCMETEGVKKCYVTDIRDQHDFRVSKAHPASVALDDVAVKNGGNLRFNIPGDEASGQAIGFDPYWFDVRKSGSYGVFVTGATDSGNHGLPYTHILDWTGKHFDDVTKGLLGGMAQTGSTGNSVADFNGDGIEDFLLNGYGTNSLELPESDPQLLISSKTSQLGKSLAIKLRGHASNADGIGAQVSVTACGKTSTRAMFLKRAPSGWSEPRLFFGLGACDSAEVVIRWPSGVVQNVHGVPPGRRVIEEPSAH